MSTEYEKRNDIICQGKDNMPYRRPWLKKDICEQSNCNPKPIYETTYTKFKYFPGTNSTLALPGSNYPFMSCR